MDRRNFLKTGGAVALLSGIATRQAAAFVPAHVWDKYDFGSGPKVTDRLNQGPFPIYPPEEVIPDSSVVMTTTPSGDIVNNYGMGLIVYVSGDLGPPKIEGEKLEKSIEDLVKIPFVQKIYMRPDWRQVQNKPGVLDLPDYWKITYDLAKKYNKQIAFRIMLENPDVPYLGAPEYLMDKIQQADRFQDNDRKSGCPLSGYARIPDEKGSLCKVERGVERQPGECQISARARNAQV